MRGSVYVLLLLLLLSLSLSIALSLSLSLSLLEEGKPSLASTCLPGVRGLAALAPGKVGLF